MQSPAISPTISRKSPQVLRLPAEVLCKRLQTASGAGGEEGGLGLGGWHRALADIDTECWKAQSRAISAHLGASRRISVHLSDHLGSSGLLSAHFDASRLTSAPLGWKGVLGGASGARRAVRRAASRRGGAGRFFFFLPHIFLFLGCKSRRTQRQSSGCERPPFACTSSAATSALGAGERTPPDVLVFHPLHFLF